MGKINDMSLNISFLGRIFKYGTISPITVSGFGLGTDNSLLGANTGINHRKLRGGLFGGGIKSIQLPRAKPEFELRNIPYPEQVKDQISQCCLNFNSSYYNSCFIQYI